MNFKKYTQYDTFTIQGHWWLPSGGERVPGELCYRDGELELRLFGGLHASTGETPFNRRPAEREVNVIHGETLDHEPITIANAFYTSWRSANRNFWSTEPSVLSDSTLHVHAVLIGIHTPGLNEKRFTACRIQIPNIEEWLGDRPFKFDSRTKGCGIRYTYPRERAVNLVPPYRRLRITPSYQPSGVPPVNRREIVHRTNFTLEATAPENLQFYAATTAAVERLLSLLVGQVVQTDRQWLRGEEGEALLFFNRTNIPPNDSLGPVHCLFGYQDVQRCFRKLLVRWLTQADDIQNTLNLFFSSVWQPGSFLETRFLPMIQCIEVYSQSVKLPTFVKPEVFAQIRDEVVESLPKKIDHQLRSAIESKLASANQYTLKERLLHLTNTMPKEMVELFCIDPENFWSGVVQTRNYLTHYPKRYKRALQGMDLHWATTKLRTAFELMLLRWSGLPDKLICEHGQKNLAWSRQRQQWQAANERGAPISQT